MTAHLDKPAEPRIAVAEELLGVGKRALYGFLASRINQFAPHGQAIGVGSVSRILPDMTGDGAFGFGVARA